MSEDLLNVREAAVLLGLSKSALDKWRCCGKGPPWHALGHAVRYSRADIAEWLVTNRCRAMPAGPRKAATGNRGGRPRKQHDAPVGP